MDDHNEDTDEMDGIEDAGPASWEERARFLRQIDGITERERIAERERRAERERIRANGIRADVIREMAMLTETQIGRLQEMLRVLRSDAADPDPSITEEMARLGLDFAFVEWMRPHKKKLKDREAYVDLYNDEGELADLVRTLTIGEYQELQLIHVAKTLTCSSSIPSRDPQDEPHVIPDIREALQKELRSAIWHLINTDGRSVKSLHNFLGISETTLRDWAGSPDDPLPQYEQQKGHTPSGDPGAKAA